MTTQMERSLSRGVPAVLCAATMLFAPDVYAQTQSAAAPKPMTHAERNQAIEAAPVNSFPLKYASEPNDRDEILTGLRVMLDPSVKLYLVPSQNLILLRGLPEDVALAKQLIAEMDRPRKTYKLELTITDSNGSEHGAPQHVTLDMAENQRVTLKQGTKVPVQTGSTSTAGERTEQMTYLDVGVNVDVTFNPTVDGGELKYKVEQSSVPADPASAGIKDPVVRQVILNGVASVPAGKAVMLGAMTSPANGHRLELSVTVVPE